MLRHQPARRVTKHHVLNRPPPQTGCEVHHPWAMSREHGGTSVMSPLALRGFQMDTVKIREAYLADVVASMWSASDTSQPPNGWCLRNSNGPLPFHRQPPPSASRPSALRYCFLRLVAGEFSNNRELQEARGRSREGEQGTTRSGAAHHHHTMPRVCLESSRLVISRKFSPGGLTICLFALSLPNPIDSLFSLFSIVHDHSCYSRQRVFTRSLSLKIRG